MQRSDHAGVSVEELGEVVVSRVLAAKQRALVRHLCLDVGVPHASTHRHTTLGFHEFRHSARGNRVVNDRGTRRLIQGALRHQRGNRRRGDRITLLIDNKAPVRVPIKSQANISLLLHDEPLQVHQIPRIQRIRLVVRESTVQFEVERAHIHVIQHRRDGVAGHAVGGIHGDDQVAVRVHRHQVAQEGGVVRQHVALLGVAVGAGVGRDAVDKHLGDFRQT